MTAVGIVGPGNAGVSLGFALSRAGHKVFLHGRQAKNLPVPLELTWGGTPPWLSAVDIVCLAVPDSAIESCAAELARSRHVERRHIVLHFSGVFDRQVLAPLAGTGASLGSFHPVQSLHDPLTAPEGLKGASVLVEGDELAAKQATELGRSLGLHPIPVTTDQKPLFHVAEMLASTFVVVLGSAGEKLLEQAGLRGQEIWQTLAPVFAGTLENMRRRGTEGAFGSPLDRAEDDAIRQHLGALPAPVRELYRALSRAAIELADLPEDRRRLISAAVD